ncbi:hypothetical protein JCM10207_003454 [Rhodosporidiobolus poonsookiae]
MLSRATSKRVSHKPAPPPPAYSARPAPPTDPLPPSSPRPTDVLLARLHELKRLAKSLAAHFSALASAEHAYGKALQATSTSQDGVRRDWLSAGLFLPPSTASTSAAGNGQMKGGKASAEGAGTGWAEWCGRAQEAMAKEAQAHLDLAKLTKEEVIDPLRRLHTGIKNFIADLDKHVGPLTEEVLIERETSIAAITHLSTSLALFRSAPLTVPASEDPLVVRATADAQLARQITKENELLRQVVVWQERAREFEEEVLEKCRSCWKLWAEESAKVHLEARQSLVKLTQRVESMPPDAEWKHFAALNHLVPAETPARNPDLIEYPQRNDAATRPLKEGLLERKGRFSKTWKEAFFVLTPAGYLHEYRGPASPVATPHISLFLPSCTVHALSSPSSRSRLSKSGKEQPAQFVIEGRKASTEGTIKSAFGVKGREVGRVYRARSVVEAQGWHEAVSKLSRASFTAHPGQSLANRQGPASSAVAKAGLPGVVEHGEQTADEAEGEGEISAEEDEPTPVPVPAVQRAPLTEGNLAAALAPPKQSVAPASGAAVAVEEAGKDGVADKIAAAATKDGKEGAAGQEDVARPRKESMVTALETQAPVASGAAAVAQPEKVEEKTAPLSMPGALFTDDASSIPSVPSSATAMPSQPVGAVVQPTEQPTRSTAASPTAVHQLPLLDVQNVSAAHAPALATSTDVTAPSSAATGVVTQQGDFTASPIGINPPPLPPRELPAPAPTADPVAPAAQPAPQAVVAAGETTSTLHPAPGPGTVAASQPVLVDSEARREASAASKDEGKKLHKKKGSWWGLGGKKA